MLPAGFETWNSRKRAAADIRPRPRGPTVLEKPLSGQPLIFPLIPPRSQLKPWIHYRFYKGLTLSYPSVPWSTLQKFLPSTFSSPVWFLPVTFYEHNVVRVLSYSHASYALFQYHAPWSHRPGYISWRHVFVKIHVMQFVRLPFWIHSKILYHWKCLLRKKKWAEKNGLFPDDIKNISSKQNQMWAL